MIFYLLILYKIPLIIKTQFPISTLLETCRSCWYLWYIPEHSFPFQLFWRHADHVDTYDTYRNCSENQSSLYVCLTCLILACCVLWE